jgi:hypothetical protein
MKKYGKIATSVSVIKTDKPFRDFTIFIPAKYCLEGKFDIYGFTIVEDTVEK